MSELLLYNNNDYPIVDIPTNKSYIPVTVYRFVVDKSDPKHWKWNTVTESKAVIPLPGDINPDGTIRIPHLEFISNFAAAIPTPKDNAGNLIYKASELEPQKYQTLDWLELDNLYTMRDYSGLDTMEGMFKGCANIGPLDGLWLTHQCGRHYLNFKEAFSGCSSLTAIAGVVDLKSLNDANFDVLVYKDRLKDMFKGCNQLREVYFGNVTNTNLINAITHKVIGCSKATKVYISPDECKRGTLVQ